MTEKKMKQIETWLHRADINKLEMQDKMAIACATMEMVEKIEPVYDKYNSDKIKTRRFFK